MNSLLLEKNYLQQRSCKFFYKLTNRSTNIHKLVFRNTKKKLLPRYQTTSYFLIDMKRSWKFPPTDQYVYCIVSKATWTFFLQLKITLTRGIAICLRILLIQKIAKNLVFTTIVSRLRKSLAFHDATLTPETQPAKRDLFGELWTKR